MTARRLPAIALWLLTHCVSGYHAESMAGDMIEQFNRGRSSGWFWRQVLVAILRARIAHLRMMGCLLMDMAVLVAMMAVQDRVRRVCSTSDMMMPASVLVVLGAAPLALLGWYLVRIGHRREGSPWFHTTTGAIVAAAILAGGVGTLTAANVSKRADCAAASCPCVREPG